MRLWTAVDRPNLMVKIPGTVEGVPVIRQMLEEGININITLLFSVASYERVARAYVDALATRYAAGLPIDRVASVASFFVSRVDTLVDKLLDEKIAATSDETQKGWLESLKGKAAIANAKIAYQKFEEIFSGADWEPLAAAGAKVQRPLWASTSVKNPAYPDTMYVDELIGPHTVNTMPRPTIAAFLDHGTVARTIDKDVAGAHKTMEDLAAAGIDIDAVTAQLEEEGIASFAKSYDALAGGRGREAVATGRGGGGLTRTAKSCHSEPQRGISVADRTLPRGKRDSSLLGMTRMSDAVPTHRTTD